MTVTAADRAAYQVAAADAAAYRVGALDRLANSPVVAAVTLGKFPVAYYRLNDPAGNAPAAPYQLLNPSFEAGSMASWNATGAFLAAQDQVQDGAWSAKVTGAQAYNHAHQQANLPVGVYKLAARIKTDTFTVTTNAGLKIESAGTGGTTATVNIKFGSGTVPAGTADWTLYELLFMVTVAGTVNLLLTNAYGGSSTGSIWFDNVTFTAADRAVDSSGNGYHGGVVYPGVAQSAAGLLPGDPADRYMTFSGTGPVAGGGYVSVPGVPALGFTGPFSVHMWVLATSLNGVAQGSNATPIIKPNVQGENYRLIVTAAGAVVARFNVPTFGLQQSASANGLVGLNQLVALGERWDGTNLDALLNGVRVARVVPGGPLGPVDVREMWIGGDVLVVNRQWAGPIKDVSIFGAALTDRDYLDLYNVGHQALGASCDAKDVAA